MSKKADSIDFIFTVEKVQTMAAGHPRITIDLQEDAIAQMAMLAECQRQGIVLSVEAIEVDPNLVTKGNGNKLKDLLNS